MARKEISTENLLSPKSKQNNFKEPRVIELNNQENDISSDIYQMLSINCKYKKQIHALLKELRGIN
jgi:hypothetical protein